VGGLRRGVTGGCPSKKHEVRFSAADSATWVKKGKEVSRQEKKWWTEGESTRRAVVR